MPVNVVKPEITNENVNSLGITDLIGEGTSLFYHSIENRIYNIQLAANRLNGLLIAPGEVFSFDKALGDVSSFTGYKQAYVIENGKTVLGDGGGVCQVSTTLFRAALHAGLPIVERNPHAYRVGYYEEDSGPGIDAAVYVPSVDLKFRNDTGHSILIQAFADTQNLRLTFDLYGTKDNRVVTIGDPVVSSQTPAPATLYQDDPTLPKGEVKQVDFAADGANVYFTRTVSKDGKVVIADKFISNYRPWQAVYLRGTKD
jgi:vancomycin resistance protein YoaR